MSKDKRAKLKYLRDIFNGQVEPDVVDLVLVEYQYNEEKALEQLLAMTDESTKYALNGGLPSSGSKLDALDPVDEPLSIGNIQHLSHSAHKNSTSYQFEKRRDDQLDNFNDDKNLVPNLATSLRETHNFENLYSKSSTVCDNFPFSSTEQQSTNELSSQENDRTSKTVDIRNTEHSKLETDVEFDPAGKADTDKNSDASDTRWQSNAFYTNGQSNNLGFIENQFSNFNPQKLLHQDSERLNSDSKFALRYSGLNPALPVGHPHKPQLCSPQTAQSCDSQHQYFPSLPNSYPAPGFVSRPPGMFLTTGHEGPETIPQVFTYNQIEHLSSKKQSGSSKRHSYYRKANARKTENHSPHSEKLLIIMRGLPGSGKSTLARELKTKSGVIISTDDYFMKDGRYDFNPYELSAAHEMNQHKAKRFIEGGLSPVIIDNTNTKAWEMKPYVLIGLRCSYRVVIKEPETWWKWNIKELERRNSHGVPAKKLEKMLERYERNVTVGTIRKSVRRATAVSNSGTMEELSKCKTNDQDEIYASSESDSENVVDFLSDVSSEINKPIATKKSSLSSEFHQTSDPTKHRVNGDTLEEFDHKSTQLITSTDGGNMAEKETQSGNVEHGEQKLESGEMKGIDEQSSSTIGSPAVNEDGLLRAENTDDEIEDASSEGSAVSCSQAVPFTDLLVDEVICTEDVPTQIVPHGDQNSKGDSGSSTEASAQESCLLDGSKSKGNEAAASDEHLDYQTNALSSTGESFGDRSCTLQGLMESKVENEQPMLNTAAAERSISQGSCSLDTNESAENRTKVRGSRSPGKSPRDHPCSSQAAVEDKAENDQATLNTPPSHQISISQVLLPQEVTSGNNENAEAKLSTEIQNERVIPADQAKDEPKRSLSSETPKGNTTKDCKGMGNDLVNEYSAMIDPHSKDSQDVTKMETHVESSSAENTKLEMSNEKNGDSRDPMKFLEDCFPHIDNSYLRSCLNCCHDDLMKTVDYLLQYNENVNAEDGVVEYHNVPTSMTDMTTSVQDTSLTSPTSPGQRSLCSNAESNNDEAELEMDKEIQENSSVKSTTAPSTHNLSSDFKDISFNSLHLTLDPALALQLLEIFGSFSGVSAKDALSESDRCIKIDQEFAKLLYTKWRKTVKKNKKLKASAEAKTTKVQSSPRVLPGSNSKQKFKPPSHEFYLPKEVEHSPPKPMHVTLHEPVSLIEIMDEQLAVHVSQSVEDVDECSNEENLDLSTKLKRSRLHGMFPGIEAVALNELFEANNYNFDKTVQQVQSSCGLTIIGNSSIFPRQKLIDFQRINKLEDVERPKEENLDLSTKLEISRLHGMFPGIEEVSLNELFEANNYNFDKTVQQVQSSCGLLISGNSSIFQQQNPADFQPINKLEDEPTEYQSLNDPTYKDFRAEAMTHFKLRDACIKKAALAYSKKQGELSLIYSQQARAHGTKIREANQRAVEKILEIRENDLQNTNTLDLHDLHVNEAIEVLKSVLDGKKQELCSPNRKSPSFLQVITGRGSHSRHGKPRIKPAVVEYLKRNGYRFEELNMGLYRVFLS